MRTSPPALLPLFRSELQGSLLTALFLEGGSGLTVSQLVDRTAATRSSVQRELARLSNAGILDRDRVGRVSAYRPADSAVREPLKELIERTLGVAPRLREKLAGIAGVEAAAIYGSWVGGPISPESDLDVLVIGTADYESLIAAVRDIERLTGREINVKPYTREELGRKLNEGSGFLRTVLSGPTTPLVGRLPEVEP